MADDESTLVGLEQNKKGKDDVDEAARVRDQKSLVLVAGHEAEDARGGGGAQEDRGGRQNDSELVVEREEDSWNAQPDDGQNGVAEDAGDARQGDVVLRFVYGRAHQIHKNVHEDNGDDRQAVHVAEHVLPRVRQEQAEGERQVERNRSSQVGVAEQIFRIVSQPFCVEWIQNRQRLLDDPRRVNLELFHQRQLVIELVFFELFRLRVESRCEDVRLVARGIRRV